MMYRLNLNRVAGTDQLLELNVDKITAVLSAGRSKSLSLSELDTCIIVVQSCCILAVQLMIRLYIHHTFNVLAPSFFLLKCE